MLFLSSFIPASFVNVRYDLWQQAMTTAGDLGLTSIKMLQVHVPNWPRHWLARLFSFIPVSSSNLRQKTHIHHITQIYFDNALSNRVYSELKPYSERDLDSPERIPFNEEDCVFRDGGSESQIAHTSEINPDNLEDGLTARLVLKLSPAPSTDD